MNNFSSGSREPANSNVANNHSFQNEYPEKRVAYANKNKHNGQGGGSNNRSRFNKNSGQNRFQNNSQQQTSQQKLWEKQYGRSAISTPKKGIRVIPISGLSEIGRNCMVFESESDMFVVDMGTDFAGDDTMGVDFVLPDISYVLENRHKMRGIVFTHGHLDHINAVPYLYDQIKDFPIFATSLTKKLIEESVFDKVGRNSTLKFNEVKVGETIKLGVFEIEFVHVNHSIPQSMALAINTPEGLIFHSGDFKVDMTPIGEEPIDLKRISELGKKGVKLALLDSTGAMHPGQSISESAVGEVLYGLIEKAKGRVFLAAFASSVGRIQQTINAGFKLGRRVTLDGRSLVNFTDYGRELDFLKIPEGSLLPPQLTNKVPDDKLIVLCTGSQGQVNSSLDRMSLGTHKFFKIKEGDTVIISASPIPGNEEAIMRVQDDLWKRGATVITNATIDVHATGHGRTEDIKTVLSALSPEYFMPVHGNETFRQHNKSIAVGLGMKRESVMMSDNGGIIQLFEGKVTKLSESVKATKAVVDGSSVGDMNDVVARERESLGAGGFMVVILIINMATKLLVDQPDVITRGFIFMQERDDLVRGVRGLCRKIFESHAIGMAPEWDSGLKRRLREEVGNYLEKETRKTPIIIPVVKIIR